MHRAHLGELLCIAPPSIILRNMDTRALLILLFISLCGFCLAADSYKVEIAGVEEKELLSQLRSASQLVALTDSPSITAAALRRRADNDLQRLLRVLHSEAYYNAKIKFSFDFDQTPILVRIDIDLGPVYPLAAYRIEGVEIRVNELELCLNHAATPEKILHAEDCLLFLLAKRGLPYAKIVQREVIADQQSKTVKVVFNVDPGPLVVFGPTSIEGNCSVKEAYFKKKIAWSKGCPFDPLKLLDTQNALEETRLFHSVNITYPDNLQGNNSIPMKIEVVEAKHRSVGAGVSYSTQLGPGVELEWEHRNVRGMGETLRADANVLEKLQEGSFQYIQPGFWHRRQELIWKAQFTHEVTKGYKETAYSLSATVQHRLDKFTTLSYGAQVMELNNRGSDRNGSFHLLKAPLTLLRNRTDNMLDPSCGSSFFGKIVPTAQVLSPKFIYSINQATATYYQSLRGDCRLVLAIKGIIGSIIGSPRREIPPSERFYAGSETTLRGYNYMTVSPLDEKNKPIGGRSMAIGTLELRWRATKSLGVAVFYDVGNVYRNFCPNLGAKLLNSIGGGLRYYTAVGPIRFDVAFPLNPRKGIDSNYQLYFSIGQAF